MNGRERFVRHMHFQKVDRIPFFEMQGFWQETVDRWRSEGLPAGVNVNDYFEFDKRDRIPVDFDVIPRFVTRTLEETDRYRIWVDDLGITKKSLKTSLSMPTFIDYPVESRQDWEKIKKRFNPDDPRRYPLDWSEELVEYYVDRDKPMRLKMPGFFMRCLQLMGLRSLSIAFHKMPDLVHEIMDFWSDFLIETSQEALEQAQVDYVTLWEDLSYKSGPSISPRLFREFMLPNYKKYTRFVRDHGVDIIMVDTDGNFNALIPLFMEGGVNGFYPMEAAAGMDVADLRKEYGRRLVFVGNIDKRVLAAGKDAIDKEIARKIPLAKEGGYIPTVDHLVPSSIPFKNYVYYINLLRTRL